MTLLHMTGMRHGADQNNPESPYFVNYDESKANPYPVLPDPLTLKNGKKVATAKDWWNLRRPEIVEDFDREIYGRVPKDTPKVTWEVTSTTQGGFGDIPTITRTLAGHVDNSAYPSIQVDIALKLTTPASPKGPVPVVIQLVPGFPAGLRVPPAAADAGRGPAAPAGPSWQEQAIARGWGYAVLGATSIQPDNGGGLRQGIVGLCGKGEPRKLDDWGALRAWAWGASRVLDYFETDKSVDAAHVAIEGHSRYGKAALVTLAYDQRFWTAYVSSSGEGGAKLHRRNWGELVENIAGAGEYYWMAGNFLKYAGPLTWGDLPVDSHELIALCAPRPVFIGSGTNAGDGWADPKGMFLAAAAAGPVYKLLGRKDLGTSEMPPVETALVAGEVAFRQHAEGHTDVPNWPTFLEFAGRHLK